MLDDVDDDEPYLMRYDAVVKYCDTDASTFANYTLPAKPIEQPEQEAVIAGKKYHRTLPEDWTVIEDNTATQINPILYTDDDKDFTINITPEEVEALKDKDGDIRYHKVLEWMLPRFDKEGGGRETLWEFQAARMRNYMKHIIEVYNYKPKYYDPFAEKGDFNKEIEGDHVC